MDTIENIIHTSNSLKLIISTSHSCARFTSSSWNASMITIVFTDVPLPLTQSRTIQAFSGTSQITVEMVAGTEWTVLNDALCTSVSDAGQRGCRRRLYDTFVDDVGDGLPTQCVIQWNRHQGVCVTGQF